jgi:uncharacterized peroxidase-related enzyme
MSDASISRYPVPALEDLPDDLRARIEPIAERSGFVPNVFVGFGHRPDELRAFLDYHDAVMDRDSGLTKAEKELIVVVTSAANECLYCVVAHGAILRIRSKRPRLADEVTVNWRSAELSEREYTICEAATTLALDPAGFDDTHRERLRAVGLDDDDIWDLGAITSLFALSNRMAHLLDLRPNPEFFAMGR